MTERFPFHFLLSCIGEGNGNPLQSSCLENPRDRGAWWAGTGEPGDAAAAAAVQHYKQFGDDKYSGAVGNEL